MKNWDEIRSAAQVVRRGTVSGAAQALGIHRATVNRHIDSLEASLGAKLFMRHARGFTPTELGLELLRVANATNDQLNQLQRHANQQSGTLSGELVITAIDVLVGDLFPALHTFRAQHPAVKVRIISSDSILRLAYGEAHISIRAGPKPDSPDNVVLPFKTIRMGLFATKDYIQNNGKPESQEDYHHHNFMGPASDTPRAPFFRWMLENIPANSIGLRSDQVPVLTHAILSGLGIGFLPESLARANPDLVEIIPLQSEWAVNSWIVTHVDLHRSDKVQAFVKILKAVKAKD